MSHPFDDAVRQLALARKALGMTQQQVDEMVGCSERLVGKWELRIRNPSLPSLIDWARVLDHEIVIGGTAGPSAENATKHYEAMVELHEAGARFTARPRQPRP